MKRLYKSRDDRVIAGVCGGVGEYFNIDPVLIRILWVVLAILGGSGILAYLVGMIIIPEPPEGASHREPEPRASVEKSRRSTSQTVWGVVLIIIGFIVLMDQYHVFRFFSPDFWRISWGIIFPVFLIIIGAIVLFRHKETESHQHIEFSEDDENTKKREPLNIPSTLMRSKKDRKLAGVCGGMGYYLKIDPTIIRLLWIIGTFATGGVAILVYIILAIVLPEGDLEEGNETATGEEAD